MQHVHNDAKRVDVSRLAVRAVLNDLWRHPPVGASLGCHDAVWVEHARHAKVGNLDGADVVKQQVGSLEVAVHDAALVQVVHATAHFGCNLEHVGRLQRTMLRGWCDAVTM